MILDGFCWSSGSMKEEAKGVWADAGPTSGMKRDARRSFTNVS
ncbi:hypothetical protein GC56T3_0633 [Geobacillus sp. C56-T3]|nr:hypothetical protein GC56T3_0633 [Geobacillus sp. C56-T3]GAJ57733.1 hypothetical protein B23_0939 [Geobacillus thermoleovorans B23]